MAEAEGFEDFVRGCSTRLLRTAYLLTGSQHGAEDLLQATLTHLYPQWHRVVAADSPVAYVRAALTNRFISSRRSGYGRDLPMWELPDGWDGADLGEAVTTRRTVWQLIATLPDRSRAAVVLRYFHDLPDTEIAELLGCRPATVRSLISRGMAAMRARYLRDLDAVRGMERLR